MVPVPISARNSHSSRLVYILFSLAAQHVPRLLPRSNAELNNAPHAVLTKREKFDRHQTKDIVFVVLIPVLVLLSGLFAGLTLGYMSLDETQLNVLSISGTPEQRKYANKIMPIRKNGHLLLVTLLLANMIVNESLPVIADPVLGGGVQSVVVSTVLIVIFSEIIPQSLFTRHGLYLGAKMAGFTKYLIYAMSIIAWPVAKLLELVLGAHHGIIYRRAELKELIAMHSSHATHGGDLKTDTVTIIGATLDLQEKVVKQAMTPIKDVFMLSIDSKLDYALLKKICQTGHSRVPVYEEVDVPVSVVAGAEERHSQDDPKHKSGQRTQKVKKIIGILLVKQCVLLDPKEATPLRKIPLNKVPFVPNNEPLLGILDKFQEGRSHMAIVSRFSVEKAASVKKAVKRGLTQRLRERVGMGESDSDTESEEEKNDTRPKKFGGRRKLMQGLKRKSSDESTENGDSAAALYEHQYDIEKAVSKDDDVLEKPNETDAKNPNRKKEEGRKSEEGYRMITGFQLPSLGGMTNMSAMEQSMPADAVLAKEGAAEFLQGFDPAVMPLGIITLEDVLEELIGEEIYDEFDTQGAHGDPYEVPPVQTHEGEVEQGPPSTAHGADATRPAAVTRASAQQKAPSALSAQLPTALKGLGFFRTRSAPPVPHEERDALDLAGGQTTEGTAPGKTVRIGEVAHQDPKAVAREPMHSTMTPIQMPKPIRSPGRSPSSVILEQHSSLSSSDSGIGASLKPLSMEDTTAALPSLLLGMEGKSKMTTGAVNVPTSSSHGHLLQAPVGLTQPSFSLPVGAGVGAQQQLQPSPHKIDKVPSRSTSPAPLEAILLDRKRRLAAAHGQTSSGGTPAGSIAPSPVPSLGGGGLRVAEGIAAPGAFSSASPPLVNPAPSVMGGNAAGAASGAGGPAGGAVAQAAIGRPGGVAPASKGTRFKSSPLGGGERAGVVVAEQLKAAYSSTSRDLEASIEGSGGLYVKMDEGKDVKEE